MASSRSRLVRSLCLALGLAVLAAAPAWALDPQVELRELAAIRFGVPEGLPQNGITALASTPDGFLWVGTQSGLARFDGVRFLVFDRRTTPLMHDHFITALLALPSGELWIGTRDGLLRRNPEGDFERWDVGDGLPESYIRSLGRVGIGALWVGTYGGGLVRFTGREPEPFEPAQGLSGKVVRALVADDDGCLWAGTSSGLYHLQSGRFRPVGEGTPYEDVFVRSLAPGPDGSLWVGSEGRGLLRLSGGRLEPASADAKIAADATVWSLCRDRHGVLWVGTLGQGLRRLDGRTVEALDSATGLASDVVWSLHEDYEGSLWVGTRSGLTQLKLSVITSYGAASGLGDDAVRTVLQTSDGGLWLGTESGLDSWRSTGLRLAEHRRWLEGEQVRSLLETPGGELWAGTSTGLYRRRPAAGDFTRLQLAGLPREHEVNALAVGPEGCVWVGSGGTGLQRLCGEQVEDFTGQLPSPVVRALLPASDGNLWIGTEGGLEVLGDSRREHFGTAEGLPSGLVFALYEDRDGVIWVGTSQGLARLEGQRIRSFGHSDDVPVDLVLRILEDDLGHLWLSTQQGLLRVDKAGLDRRAAGLPVPLRWWRYDELDGMGSSECNGGTQPAGWMSSDGRLWFPTYRGVSVVDPQRLGQPGPAPRALISGFSADGRAMNPSRSLNLDPGTEEVSLSYTAPSFIAPQKLRFRYRLEGFHSAWVNAGSRRSATFASLRPGHYRFRVQATVSGDEWHDEGAQLSFFIKPHFWQTGWFVGLVAVLFLVTGPAAYRYRMVQAGRRQRELEALVEERTSELAAANERLERLATLDSLTGVANQRRFREVLEVEWKRHSRYEGELSLILLDVDRFKEFNDRYGHLEGDRALRAVARVMTEAVSRESDLVARYGGEEFTVILPDTDGEGAQRVAELIRSGVAAREIAHEASPVAPHLTVSLGVATITPDVPGNPDRLVALADAAMYRAKSEGRNRVCVAEAG